MTTRHKMRGARRTRKVALALVPLMLVLYMLPSAARAANAPPGYRFSVVAVLGQSAPGGGAFTTDFEPSAINNSGAVAFTADIDASGDEGVFLAKGGTISQLIRAGLPAPGNNTFGPGELGRLALNDWGDVAASFSLNPFDPNIPGLPGGVFRFAHTTNRLSPVLLPGVAAPGGGTFAGTFFNDGINSRGDIVYPGLATGSAIVPPGTPPNYNGMSLALFEQNANGTNTRLVGPGDAAPGGHTFDDAWNGANNAGGDVAFSGHVVGDSCTVIGPPFVCGDSLYLRNGTTGAIRSVAHQGDPAPGGNNFVTAFGGLVNNFGQIAFLGQLDAPTNPVGVYQYANGSVRSIARPGDPMPGGGNFSTAANNDATYGTNNRGDVSFAAMLDTDSTGSGINDTGVYVSSHGAVQLVARTGTVLPGIGTISRLGQFTIPNGLAFGGGGMINDFGKVLLNATLTDGTGVLLVATPTA